MSGNGKLIVTIGGVDMSDQFIGMTIEPAGPGAIGRADLSFEKQAGGLTITEMMPVQVYFAFNAAGAGVAARGRLFGGVVANRKTSAIATTKTWQLTCQDYNVILDAVVRDATPAYAITLTAGSFAAQILQVVGVVQRNGGGSVNTQIDATTSVSNLYTGIMPSVTLPPGKKLRYYIQAICDAAQVLTPALRPRFFMGTGDTFGVGDTFGGPVLHIYDAALTPSPDWTFDETNVWGVFTRDGDATQLTQRQQSVYGEGFVATYAETASGTTYPNPYINHGIGSGSNNGYWMSEPLEDSESTNNAAATAVLTKVVQQKAYPRETIEFSTYNMVRPGDIVDLSWALEGLSHYIKRVVAVSYAYEEVGVIYANVTLSAKKLRLGETGDEGVDEAPQEGDPVPPNPPTGVTVDFTAGVFDPTTGLIHQPVTWTRSTSADANGYKIYATQGSFHWPASAVPDGASTSATILLRPGESTAINMTTYDSATPPNESAHTTPDVTGTAAEPAPSASLYNPGFEVASPWDSTKADGWLAAVGGGGVVTRSNTYAHSGTWAIKLDSSSGVGGTSSKVTSRYMTAQAGVRHRVALWSKSAFAGSYLTVKVSWYTAALALISTTTLVTNAALTTTWQQFAYSPTAPATTGALKIEVSNTVAGGQAIWADDIDVQINPATPTFYNGSFEITQGGLIPQPLLPDGWTVTGTGTYSLSGTQTRDGQLALFTRQATGQTITFTSTPMVFRPSVRPRAAISVSRLGSTLTGLDFNLVYRDASGAVLSTVLLANNFGGGPTGWLDFVYAGPGIAVSPASTASVEVQLVYEAQSGANPLDTYVDRIQLTEDTSYQDSSGVTQGDTYYDGAGSALVTTTTAASGYKVTSANGILLGGALGLTTASVSAWPYTATAAVSVIFGTSGATNRVLNLPTAVGIAGRLYMVKKVDAGAGKITLTPNGVETIDGLTSIALTTQYQVRTVMSDGANWQVMTSYL